MEDVEQKKPEAVTTLRVVWIEILPMYSTGLPSAVTTLRVVWIEITACLLCIAPISASPPCGWCGLKSSWLQLPVLLWCHHLAGGVDWNYLVINRSNGQILSPPCGWCGLKSSAVGHKENAAKSPPCGWCGLKCFIIIRIMSEQHVTTLRVVWIEITRAIVLLCCSRSPPCRWCFERKYIIAIRVFM